MRNTAKFTDVTACAQFCAELAREGYRTHVESSTTRDTEKRVTIITFYVHWS